MSLTSDLGPLADLAKALGILDADGTPDDGWLRAPGEKLSRMLADDGQREALIRFVDEVLGGSAARRTGDVVWLPVVEIAKPRLSVFVVLDVRVDRVVVGLGATLTTTGPDSRTTLHLPIFQAGRGSTAPDQVIVLGTPFGRIALDTEVAIDAQGPAPGALGLRAVRLGLSVPTDGADPTISVRLMGLQLPGTRTPRDVALDIDDLDELDDAVRDLLLGLLAQQASAAGGAAEALAGMLGLSGDAVPVLPVDRLAAEGPAALKAWFTDVVSSALDAWLGHLATLLGGNVDAGEVAVTFNGVALRLGLRETPGADGRPEVAVSLTLKLTANGLTAKAQADLLRISLGGAGVVALPRFEVVLLAGRESATDPVLLASGGVEVETARIGVLLDARRRPTLVLAADGVTVGGTWYATVDLSSPDAVAEAAGTVIGDVIDDLLAGLGAVGDVVRVVLGFRPPTGFPAVPTLDLADFLRDPVGAVAARWKALLGGDPLAVRAVLTPLRAALADAGVAGQAVTGTGTETDPWRVPLVGPIGLLAWKTDAGRLAAGLGTSYSMTDLGHGCTEVATTFRLVLVDIDLVARSAAFLRAADVEVLIRACDPPGPLRLEAGPLELTADAVELTFGWLAGSGLSLRVRVPGAELVTPSGTFSLPLPEVAGDGTVTFAEWDALEGPLAAIASISAAGWLTDLTSLFGWSGTETGPRLALADLVATPDTALRTWLVQLLLSANPDVLALLARLLGRILGSRSGTTGLGVVTGAGTPGKPYLLPLSATVDAPALALWWTPEGPAGRLSADVTDTMRGWRPGDRGLPSVTLEDALAAQGALHEDVADLLAGRPSFAAGLEALADRWLGTDGLVAPPATVPPGITEHLVSASYARLAAELEPAEVLGVDPPATVVHVAVDAPGAWLPPDWPSDGVVDLRAPGLSPEAFPTPVLAAGECHVLLGGRAACRLADGDADGVLGQAARLRRVAGALTGPVCVIGYGAGGHAALRAAQALPAVTSVVTVGTPLTPVTFAVIDSDPAGDTLRLLHRLLPQVSTEPDDEPDDGDLATGRALVGGLMALTRIGDSGGELGPPTTTDAATGGLPAGFPRAGLAAHAVFGALADDDLRRALTAIVAAGLATRANARADASMPAPAELHAGLRVPLRVAGAGNEITVDGHLQLELVTVAGGVGTPVVTADPRATVRLGLGRVGGWLVGGPDPSRAPGSERESELRRMSLRVDLPLSGAGADNAALVLHEVRVFELDRERWVVGPEGLTDPLADAVTVVLPEVRVVLSRLAERLGAPGAGPAGLLLSAMFRLAGLLDAAGGFLPDGIDDLIHDPLSHVGGLNLVVLVDALRDLLPNATGAGAAIMVGPLTLTPDLGKAALDIAVAAPEGVGAVGWSATASIRGGTVSWTVRLGGEQVRLEVGGLPVTAAFWWGDQRIPLAAADPAQLARLIAQVLPAEVVRLALDALRDLDLTVRPVVNAALAALGLLGLDDRVLLPAALLVDPRAWLTSVLGGGPAGLRSDRVIALLDALRPLLGVPGGPGVWALATGVELAAAAVGVRVRLGVSVDTGAFADPGGGRLALGGSAALLIASHTTPDIAVTAYVGRAGVAVAGREAVHLAVSTGTPVSLLLRPSSGPDITLLPGGPGLGGLAQGAARLLPLVLDAIAAEDGADLAGDLGRVVAAIGDVLALRTGTPPSFAADRLLAWRQPAEAFAAAWPTLSGTALTALASALQPVVRRALGSASVTVVDGALRVVIQRLTATLAPAPFAIGVLLDVPVLDGVGRVRAGLTLDGDGLRALDAEVGPVEVDLGDVRLAPFAAVHVGNSPDGGRRVEAGLDLGGGRAVLARWVFGGSFGTVVRDGGVEDPSAAVVALALVEAVFDVVGAVALSSDEVEKLLNKPVGGRTVAQVLEGVLLKPGAARPELDDNLFDLAALLDRIKRLARNLVQAAPSVTVEGLTIGLADVGGSAGVTIGISGRFPVVPAGAVIISLENDATWIHPAVPAGLSLGLVDLTDLSIRPALVVGGLGIRFAGGNGPLVNTGISLDSIALHAFAKITGTETSGGAQIQLSGLGVAVCGASGGNQVASSMLAETGSGGQRLAPKFSPALAVQRHGTGPVAVSLSAGPGSGPWWLVIQRGFGPIYVEQIGLGVTVEQNRIERIGILLDGRVSLFGLTAAVDDLQIACVVGHPGAPWSPSAWSVDLAGLAIDADMGGLVLQGGLRKFTGEQGGVEYVGMLLARFGVYGLSIYGGYGRTTDESGPFASFFAFGAIVGPIGGPPAFFVTGIGGGFGINRRLVVPTDLSRFGDFPLIKALDPGAKPSGDPMAEMTRVRATFPAERGSFWFAGGLSFTSFALVDGVAVVAIQIGDGFEIAILGLARMALPRPQFALVSIELALVARFSTREGVLWIQAQLTDNSWLLYPEVRLTGGFAYVLWFAGPRRGEFVLTIGGYDPDFHRDGYPQVPRLGLAWRFGPAVVKGESYFALTSEAVMAGVRVEASATFGPAWAHVEFGASAIVYFDPFHFKVTVYASISAGITIDLWIAEITISINIGARVMVEGPDFHAIATFEVGPVELSVELGEQEQEAERYLHWNDFVPKYLEAAGAETARALSAIPGRGAVPPQTPVGADRPKGVADGTVQRPFEVLVEFDITITSTVPLTRTEVGLAHRRTHPNAGLLGISPMGRDALTVTLRATLLNASGGVALDPVDGTRLDDAFIVTHRDSGTFPKGIWGKPKSLEARDVPAGDIIPGVEGVTLTAVARPGTRIGPYPYRRVEVRRRQPLPFVSEQQARSAFLSTAADVASVIGKLDEELDPAKLLPTAILWLRRDGRGRTSLAAFTGERTTPPRLGTLTDRLAVAELPATDLSAPSPPARPPVDGTVHPPIAIAVLTDPAGRLDIAVPRTTVGRMPSGIPRLAPPSLPLASATVDNAIAGRLVLVTPASAATDRTLVAAGALPVTTLARSGAEASSALGSTYDGVTRLAALTSAISRTPKRPREQVRVGEIAVLRLPNADADLSADQRPTLLLSNADARVVAFSSGGGVLLDRTTAAAGAQLIVPQGVERLAIAAIGAPAAGSSVPGLSGWHSGQSLPYVGWSTALCAGGVVSSEGRVAHRDVAPMPTGWAQVAELVAGATLVQTRFAAPASVLVIAIDDPAAQLGAEGRALQLGMTGATRRVDAAGEPLPPVSLVTGGRTFLLYEVTGDEPVAVTVACDVGWRLAGVLAATGTVADVSGRLARSGLDTSVAPLTQGTTGSLRIGWLGVSEKDRVVRRRT